MKLLPDEQKMLVEWIASDGNPVPGLPQEEVNAAIVRPVPPPLEERSAWNAALAVGGPHIDFYLNNLWWDVRVDRRAGDNLTVIAPLYKIPNRRIPPARLRPSYRWSGWEGGWKCGTQLNPSSEFLASQHLAAPGVVQGTRRRHRLPHMAGTRRSTAAWSRCPPATWTRTSCRRCLQRESNPQSPGPAHPAC